VEELVLNIRAGMMLHFNALADRVLITTCALFSMGTLQKAGVDFPTFFSPLNGQKRIQLVGEYRRF
jgi:hypothetical protein